MKPVLALLLLCAWSAPAGRRAPPVTHIRAVHHDGQTFLTWTDAAPGAAGGDYRYDVYRSVSPITSAASLQPAALVQAGVFNNSGQLGGQFPFNQATRQDQLRPMAIVRQDSCGKPGAYMLCGTPVPPFTGIAVHTAASAAMAYYAVVTVSVTHAVSASEIVPGSNATTEPVEEKPAPLAPLKIYDSNDAAHRAEPASVAVTGRAGLPLWLFLHASGAGPGVLAFGDLYQYWGDSTMGYQEGIPGMFSVYEDRGGSLTGRPSLIVSPLDTVWTPDALGQLETFWFGYIAAPLGSNASAPRALPATESRLLWLLNWAIAKYQADPNRIYAGGQSMGGWGISSWCLRHPEIFAALFAAMPRWRQTAVPDMIHRIPFTATPREPLLAGGKTSFLARTDSVAYVEANCGAALPFIVWGIGRHDGYATWREQVDMVAALRKCHAGFAFRWNNGSHSDGPTAEIEVQRQYQTRFARNLSYPAFTNSSLDQNPGNGDVTEGALEGCINCGFAWTAVTETFHTWSAAISNSNNSHAMTADVTPRNTRQFHPRPGAAVAWLASTGQSGRATADPYGLVTAERVNLPANSSTRIEFRLEN